MNNELRNEFEEYVKKLTSAICKDIFLEQLEQLYLKYEDEYELYADLLVKSDGARVQLETQVKDASRIIKKVEAETNKSLTRLNNDIIALNSSTEKIVDDLYEYNDQKAKEFVEYLSSYIERYKNETAAIFKEGERKISNKLAGVITPELLQHFIDELRKNTAETKNLATFVGGSYKKEVEESIKGIVASNRRALETMDATISEYVKSMMISLNESQEGTKKKIDNTAKQFSDTTTKYVTELVKYLNEYMQRDKEERKKAIREQKRLIAEIGPSDEKMDQLEQKVIRLQKTVMDMTEQENENYKKMIDILYNSLMEYKNEQMLQRGNMDFMRRENIELARQTNMLSTIIVLLVCLLFLIQVFNIFEFKGVVIAIGIIGTIVMTNSKLKQSILWTFNNKEHD